MPQIMALPHKPRAALYALLALLAANCAAQKSRSAWEDIDYSHLGGGTHENDANYKAPSVAACSDDDLYNCK